MNGLYQKYVWPSIIFIWLRARIRYNQMTHSSKIAQAFAVLGMIFVAMSTVSVWVVGVLTGLFLPSRIGLENNYLIWDVAALIAVLSWAIHVLNEAQRGDPISLDRILHLPVSPGQAFVVNYFSSLGSTVFLMTAGGFLGLVVGSLFSVGPKAILFLFPAIAFLFAMTAITYWLQGWIAGVMSNPRKRQTIIVMIPIAIVLVTQVPVQLIQWSARSSRVDSPNPEPAKAASPSTSEPTDSNAEVNAGESGVVSGKDIASIEPATPVTEVKPDEEPSDKELGDKEPGDKPTDAPETGVTTVTEPGVVETEKDPTETVSEAQNSREARSQKRKERREAIFEQVKSIATVANIACPPLWPAGAVQSWSTGSFWNPTPLFFTLIMFLGGVQSLRLSHRATLRYWRGEDTKKATVTAKSTPKPTRVQKESRLCEFAMPWLSEETSAIAGMTWATMKRAPEIKLFMLLPMILPIILLMVFRERMLPSNDILKTMLICGFSTFFLLVASGVAGNMFAYDRSGFRVFVLSSTDRTRILLGRNLAFAPLLLFLCILSIVGFAVFYGVSIRSTVVAILVTLTMLPPYFLVMNLMSILTPFPLAAGSIQPKHFDFTTVIINVLLSMILPFILIIAMIPVGVQYLVGVFSPSISWLPLEAIAGLTMCTASLLLYRWILPWQGQLLANREKELLRKVTSKVE